jgi:hypothetical protein
MKEKPKSTTTKVVTIKKGSASQLEPKPSARDRLDAVLEAERFRLSSLMVSLALIIVFSAIILQHQVAPAHDGLGELQGGPRHHGHSQLSQHRQGKLHHTDFCKGSKQNFFMKHF